MPNKKLAEEMVSITINLTPEIISLLRTEITCSVLGQNYGIPEQFARRILDAIKEGKREYTFTLRNKQAS
jgi:hypothetical protein